MTAARATQGLVGHRVVVVGGSSGMGAAAVPVLRAAGARVAAFDLPRAVWPQDVADAAELAGVVDVTDEPTIESALTQAREALAATSRRDRIGKVVVLPDELAESDAGEVQRA